MSGRRLYIGRLPQDVTRKDLDGFFGAIGPIVDIRIMAGFCFLEFEELKVSLSSSSRSHIPSLLMTKS